MDLAVSAADEAFQRGEWSETRFGMCLGGKQRPVSTRKSKKEVL